MENVESDAAVRGERLRASLVQSIGCAECGKKGVVLHKCAGCNATSFCGKMSLSLSLSLSRSLTLTPTSTNPLPHACKLGVRGVELVVEAWGPGVRVVSCGRSLSAASLQQPGVSC